MRIKIVIGILIFLCLIPFYRGIARETLELTIDEAVGIAIKNNRSVIIAERKVDEQKAGMGEVRSTFFPKMTGSANYTKLDVAPYIALGKKSPFPMPPGSPKKITIGDDHLYDLSFSVQQPLFTGFALTNGYEMAKDSWEAAKNEHAKVENNIIFQTKEAYYTLLKLGELVEISIESVKLMEAHITDLTNMLKVGMIAENDLLKAQVQLSETKLMLISAENNEKLMQRQFCTVLRIPLTTVIELETPLEYSEERIELDAIIETALENRPEIHVLENQVQIAEKGVAVAKSQRYPQLLAVYNYNYKRPNREYEKEFYSTWTAGLVAQLNIFDWGGIHYSVTQAKLRHRQSEEGKKQLADAIILEANQAYLNLREAIQRIRVAEVNITQAEENYRVTQKKFSHGLVTNTELLDANTALTRARMSHTTALSDYLMARAMLEKVTGIENK